MTAPTPDEGGYTTHTCTRCGDSYVDELTEALGHKCAAFTDISGHWAKDFICFATEQGLFQGVTDTTFVPDGAMSRAMAVTVLYRLAGEPEVTGETAFTDVNEEAYYYRALLWASQNEIAKGMTGTAFAPQRLRDPGAAGDLPVPLRKAPGRGCDGNRRAEGLHRHGQAGRLCHGGYDLGGGERNHQRHGRRQAGPPRTLPPEPNLLPFSCGSWTKINQLSCCIAPFYATIEGGPESWFGPAKTVFRHGYRSQNDQPGRAGTMPNVAKLRLVECLAPAPAMGE